MSLGEHVLYRLAKWLYRSEIAHSTEMKQATSSAEKLDQYRANEIHRIISAASRFDVRIEGQRVLDFGCADGVLSRRYLQNGAAKVVGIDIDGAAVERAVRSQSDSRLSFFQGSATDLPIPDASVDLVLSYDVFEHVSNPAAILKELRRVLVPGGTMLIGTWGWRHPFAPHLWAVMPVPWAHLFVSEATLLKACRRVYLSPWYVPNINDIGPDGERVRGKYEETEISTDYLNKYLIVDFERAFAAAGFQCSTHAVPFSSRAARWSAPLIRLSSLREFLSGYVWFVLRQPGSAAGYTELTEQPVTASSRER
jgi:SAM-dependent methyltransferase